MVHSHSFSFPSSCRAAHQSQQRNKGISISEIQSLSSSCSSVIQPRPLNSSRLDDKCHLNTDTLLVVLAASVVAMQSETYAMLSRYADNCIQQRVLMHTQGNTYYIQQAEGPSVGERTALQSKLLSHVSSSLPFFPLLLPFSPFNSPQKFPMKQITVHMILPSPRTQTNQSDSKLSDGAWRLSHSFSRCLRGYHLEWHEVTEISPGT